RRVLFRSRSLIASVWLTLMALAAASGSSEGVTMRWPLPTCLYRCTRSDCCALMAFTPVWKKRLELIRMFLSVYLAAMRGLTQVQQSVEHGTTDFDHFRGRAEHFQRVFDVDVFLVEVHTRHLLLSGVRLVDQRLLRLQGR